MACLISANKLRSNLRAAEHQEKKGENHGLKIGRSEGAVKSRGAPLG